MDKKQQEIRRSAAENFLRSFEEELLNSFRELAEPPEAEPPQAEFIPPMNSDVHPQQPISLSDLEEAILDIDQYLLEQGDDPVSGQPEKP